MSGQLQGGVAGRTARPRPSLADIGLNPLAKRLLGLQFLVVLILLFSLDRVGLSIDWRSSAPMLTLDVVVAALWVHMWRSPGRQKEWFVAETVAAFLLMLTASHIFAPAQYVAVALKRPLIDAALAKADAAMGINVASVAAWTHAHPRVSSIFTVAYFSFLPQLAVLVPLIGLAARDREAMWEAVFHFHLCALITVLALAAFPAAHAFQYLHFESTLDQSRLISQFNGIRDGSFTVIQFNNLEGLISMPSFHCAGALIVVRALRRHTWFFRPAVALNVLLAAATVFTGAHYVVDLFGTLAMFGASVWLWNASALKWLTPAAPAFALDPVSVGGLQHDVSIRS